MKHGVFLNFFLGLLVNGDRVFFIRGTMGRRLFLRYELGVTYRGTFFCLICNLANYDAMVFGTRAMVAFGVFFRVFRLLVWGVFLVFFEVFFGLDLYRGFDRCVIFDN